MKNLNGKELKEDNISGKTKLSYFQDIKVSNDLLLKIDISKYFENEEIGVIAKECILYTKKKFSNLINRH